MNFVIVDVETTGGSPKNSKITEIAMYKYDGIQIIDDCIKARERSWLERIFGN